MYRLLPISLFELSSGKLHLPNENAKDFVEASIGAHASQSDMEQLIRFSGFPEPLAKGDEVFSSNWHDEYIDTLLREDLKDLTKIHELENVITLMHLLPERVGAPLSINSLKEDMETSYNAVRNYVKALVLTYVIFRISPWHKKIARTVKKEGKVYFFDWSQVKDESCCFENYIACELKHRVELWTVTTKFKFDLYYIRTRDGKETDFLITRDDCPYLLVEVKLSSENIESHNISHAKRLNVPIVQLIKKPGVIKAGKGSHFIVSASNFLG